MAGTIHGRSRDVRRFFRTVFLLALLAALGAAAAGWWWVQHPLKLRDDRMKRAIGVVGGRLVMQQHVGFGG